VKIFLANDDGIGAPGLAALAQELGKIGELIIFAPASEMSAVGHAITLTDPLRVTPYYKDGQLFGNAVSGTPADSVKIGLWVLQKQNIKPDILISGINLGSNTGINTIYSGTVSAATEGAFLGISSFAISLATFTNPDFKVAAQFARSLAEHLVKNPLPPGIFLNVNVPALPRDQILGYRFTRQGQTNYIEEYEIRKDPLNRDYYWLTGEKREVEPDEDVDDRAILNREISITPIHYDLTFYPILPKLHGWKIDF
jgi:5'-nucleotidase